MAQPLGYTDLPRVQKHPGKDQWRSNKLHNNQQIQAVDGIVESPLAKISEPAKKIGQDKRMMVRERFHTIMDKQLFRGVRPIHTWE